MIRSQARALHQWWSTHPRTADALFALAVGSLMLTGLLTAPIEGSQQEPDVWAVALIAVQTVGFAFRRRAAFVSFAIVLVAVMAYWVADYPSDGALFSLLSVYSTVAHGGPDRRLVWRVVGAGVAAMTATAIAGVITPTEDLPPAAVLGIAALHITAAVVGEIVVDRRRRMAEFEQRMIRAETERELLARQAVLDERARIARDLHDVVAHGMSVMVVQAGAAERVVHHDADAAARALSHIQQAGRDALADMRRMLGVLRDGEGTATGLAPQPTIADLGALARHCTDSGIETTIRIEGTPSPRAPGQEMAVYRVVQEALTNVLKHAEGASCASVIVTHHADHIAIEVLDDGAGASDEALRRSVGHGLVGMRERVDLYGGSLHFGPAAPGGFRVAATIPYDAVAVGAS